MSQSEGIVLNEIRFKETSKILRIYTKEFGKISVMAKGAYNPKSRLTAYTQVFTHCNYEFHKGRTWYYINEGSILNSFYELREEIERTIYGFYILELIDKGVPIEEKNERLFLLLEKTLLVFSKLNKDFLKYLIAFELKYISFIGYRPILTDCVICQRKNTLGKKFSINYGGIVCEKCNMRDNQGVYVDKYIQKSLVKLMYSTYENLENVEIKYEILIKIQRILEDYILYNLDRKSFNSLDMLNEIISLELKD